MTRRYKIVLEPPQEGDSHWVASVPGLHCFAQGRTRREALARIKQTILFAVETLQKERGSVPKPLRPGPEVVTVEVRV